MNAEPKEDLPDPAEITNGEEFADAAKRLKAVLKLTGTEIRKASGLAEGTISDLVNGNKFPRIDTFREFIAAGCGQEWEPWRQAWDRAARARRDGSEEEQAAERIVGLETRIEALEADLNDVLARAKSMESELAQLQAGGDDARLEAERRARTDAATDRVIEALRALKSFRGRPIDPRTDERSTARAELIENLRVASLDVAAGDLRARLLDAITILDLWDGPEKYARWSESRTRFIAVEGAMEATGAWRRRERLPEAAEDFVEARDFAVIYLEELTANNPGR
ncbi:helix-turn-helix domain-containing protein [Streptacidiphilus albus]|uniref:helix-turn-helix domain-containing protein n=1 Tax=Streptacidiphilus albus TaxID=105425 RepID=UPI00054B2024|nr:hypothetical protein [Streptacidiphilus albus]